MTLREAVEALGSSTRAERERGAAIVIRELKHFAQREGSTKDQQADAVGDIVRNLLQLCAAGVPAQLPADAGGLQRYLARAIRNWHIRQASSPPALRGMASLPHDAEGDLHETAAYRDAEVRISSERAEDSAREALGERIFEDGIQSVRELARIAINARLVRYRDETIRSWNELVDFCSGRPLDDVIRASGGDASPQARNQRYTNFKRLRGELEAALASSGWSDEKVQISRAFIETMLLRPGQVSDLSRLRVTDMKVSGATEP